jgi:hypothetical protein
MSLAIKATLKKHKNANANMQPKKKQKIASAGE